MLDCIVGFILNGAERVGLLDDFPLLKDYMGRIITREHFVTAHVPPDRRPETLYFCYGTRASRVMWTVRELMSVFNSPLPLNVKDVNIFKGEHKTEDYLEATGGAAQVPVLVSGDGKLKLTESVAIVLHLVSKFHLL